MSSKPRCAREGCHRRVAPTAHRFCTPICAQLSEEWQYLQRQQGLDTPEGTAAWVALAAAGDAWTEYLTQRGALRASTRENPAGRTAGLSSVVA